jgi:dipeptidyl aminopeptidase/acylaminoacyl peptidase
MILSQKPFKAPAWANILLTFSLCWGTNFINAQKKPAHSSALLLDTIMKGEDFVGYSPESIIWDWDSKRLYFSWNPALLPQREWYSVEARADARPQKLGLEAQTRLPMGANFVENVSKTLKVYEHSGDIFLYDNKTQSSRPLTQTFNIREHSPLFLQNNDSLIGFVSNQNLFFWDLRSNLIQQKTNFNQALPAEKPKLSAHAQHLETQQAELFGFVRRQAQTTAYRDSLEGIKKQFLKQPRPLSLRPEQVWVSPSADWVVCVQTSKPAQENTALQTHVPEWIRADGRVESSPRYRPKVGSVERNGQELCVYGLATDSLYKISFSNLPNIRSKPNFHKEYYPDTAKKPYSNLWEKDLIINVLSVKISPKGQLFAELRSADNKNRWIVQILPEKSESRCLFWEQDTAWVRNYNGEWGILGEEKVWFLSESEGYTHLYTVDIKNSQKTALTQGKYELITAQLSQNGEYFYLLSSEGDFRYRDFYRLHLPTMQKTKLSRVKGGYEAYLSPDERLIAYRFSTPTLPWELYIQANHPDSLMHPLTDSRTQGFKSYNWQSPTLEYFPARDGQMVSARVYTPKKGAPVKKAAVIFVHGAGYLQNAHGWWSQYYREFMFHNLLTEQGYTVLDIDYRGSAGYGRDWRTGIYRHMGGKDLSDHVDGADFLVKKYGIHPQKIGIYGGSYGGFITLMGLFTSPKTFACGAALRAVTDWAHYNHPYTSNILNLPQEDSLAYRRSSPIYWAENLERPLLMLHGLADDNVQPQDIIRLSQRLIELRKENWELALYPVEPHGFIQASSWADEYKRIFKLFEQTIGK